MANRTHETTVTFQHPFSLPSLGIPLPAGTYRLIIEEEEVLGLSFLAYRRTSTLLQIPAVSTPSSRIQMTAVDAAELSAALQLDLGRSPEAS